MKKLIIILFTSVSLFAGSTLDILVERGNKRYEEQKFEEAISEYETVILQGYESGVLYYNLGNAYFNTGNLGKAILSYEKSLKLNPGDEDTEYNLSIAKAKTVDQIQEVPQIFIIEWWDSLLATFSVVGWSIITLIVYITSMIFAGLFWLGKTGSVKRAGFYGSSITAILFVLFLAVTISDYSKEHSQEYGVLLTDTVAVKTSPDETSNDAFVVHEGVKFIIEDNLRNWYRIKLADGKVGWVRSNDFETI